MSASVRIAWREVVTTHYDVEVSLEDLPASLRTGDGRHLTAAQLDELRAWLIEAGNDSLSGAADLESIDVHLLHLGRRRIPLLEDDDTRPLPFVGDLLRIRYVGGDWLPAGEVTQVTGSVVTLEHTHDFDLQLAEDWEVLPRPAAYGPGPYGYNPSPAHIERVEAELARQREQASRRRAERPW